MSVIHGSVIEDCTVARVAQRRRRGAGSVVRKTLEEVRLLVLLEPIPEKVWALGVETAHLLTRHNCTLPFSGL